jgi:type IV pilus assembly protein PilB
MLRKKLGELLLEEGVITHEQLAGALTASNGARLGETLVTQGLVSEEKLYRIIAKQHGARFVLLRDITPEQEAVKLLSAATARRYRCLPLKRTPDTLQLAIADPLNVLAVSDISLITGLKVELVVMTPRDIEKALARLYGETTTPGEVSTAGEGEATPVVRMVNRLIAQACQERASDIHLESQDDGVRVRYRVDGVLQDVSRLDKDMALALFSRLKVMAQLDISERRLPQDGSFRFNGPQGSFDLRVSTLPTVSGEKVVLRLLNSGRVELSLQKLGLAQADRERLERMLTQSYGMILITGPTGSGKTTTLYSAVHHLHHPSRNICTVEDPVEFRLPGITQVNVNQKIGLSFASVLRAFVRQDPDVILVGEIRDYETADIAIRSALTGHLVLSSLHTNDAASTVTRLSEMGVEPFLIAASIVGVVAQRLVRKLCPACRQPHVLPAQSPELRALGLDAAEQHKFYLPTGCDKCHGEGFRGRVGVFEVMSVGEEMRAAIVRQAATGELRAAARRAGSRSLLADAVDKAREGLTTVAEALRVAYQEG